MIKINVKKTACVEQFANGSAVFWVTAHLFDAAWKLNCSSVLTTDTAPLKQLYCWGLTFTFPQIFLRWPQPWSLLTIMLLWHSFLIIIILLLLLLFLCVPNFNGCRNQYWVCVSTMTGTVCFERKNICNAKFGDLGPMGTGVKNLSSKVPYLESSTLICLFTMPLLCG